MLTMKSLPLKNLRGYTGRTTALVLFSALMAIAVFGGSMVVIGVQQGLEVVQNRLGADIVVTPADARSEFDAQTVLMQAEPNYFYMEGSKLDEVAAVDGVAAASPQMFLASAKASCCSARLQIIAFDPASDFAIQPWIAESFGTGELGLFDIVVGSNVTVYDDRIIWLYGHNCQVVGQFAPTGSTLDNAVYTNFDTVRELITASFEKRLNKYPDFDPNAVISSVLVKVEPGRDAAEVAEAIEEQVEGVSVATSTNMVSDIAERLAGVSSTVTVFVAMFWLIGLAMTVLVFAMTVHARRREFATMRAVGASKHAIRQVVIREAVLVILAGGVAGIVLSAAVLYSFSVVIGEVVGAGFVVPGPATAAVIALATLIVVLVAAALAAFVAVRQVNKMDASVVLKEGE